MTPVPKTQEEDRNQSMKAGRNGPLYFSWATNNSGLSWPDQTGPDPASPDQTRREHSKWNGPDWTEPVWRKQQTNGSEYAYFVKQQHQCGPVRFGQVGPGPIISPLPFLRRSEGTEGGAIESGEIKKLIGPQTVKPHPLVVTCWHPIGCLHHSQKTERALLPLVTTASGRKGCFFPPIGQF